VINLNSDHELNAVDARELLLYFFFLLYCFSIANSCYEYSSNTVVFWGRISTVCLCFPLVCFHFRSQDKLQNLEKLIRLKI